MSKHTNFNVYISEVCTYGSSVAGGHGRKSGGFLYHLYQSPGMIYCYDTVTVTVMIYCRSAIGVGLLGRAMTVFDDRFEKSLTNVNGEFTVEVPVQSQAKKAEMK